MRADTITRPSRLGKYDLIARIAKGGMAEIYLARQRGMVGFSRLVVVKRILPHLAEEPEFVSMFMEEARLAALINHSNIAQVYDVGQFEGSYYIAMELINGPSLGMVSRECRSRHRPIPYPVAAEIIIQACDGLHAAHELRDEGGAAVHLVHRDISPHNLMLTLEGTVKLVDFGIAKAQDTAVRTHTGKIKGKYPYMSPEQCRGEPLDRRTDLFSLGIVMHELLTARRLFQRSTELMTLKAITEEEVPTPRELQPGVPAGVCDVTMRALEHDPERRYANAAEMGSALRAVLSELSARTSSRTVSTYLETNHGALLATRERAMREVLALQPADGSPPLVSGLDGGTGGSASAAARGEITASRAAAPPRPRRRGLPRGAILAVVVVLLATAAGIVVRLVRAPAAPTGPPLYLGLPPAFPEGVAQRDWEPLLEYLGQRLGRPVKLVVPDSYRELSKMLLEGEIHVANLPALQFVLARQREPRLIPLVTHTIDGALTYQSYIVARSDGAVSSLQDLAGRTFCYSDSGSTSGYLLPRHLLREQGLDPDSLFGETQFSGNHVSVMKDVLAGKCDAGAVFSQAMLSGRTLRVSNSQLQVLAVAGKIPYDAICASPTLPTPLRERLRLSLLELNLEQLLGRRVLGPAFRIDGFVEVQPGTFADIEAAARAEHLLR